MPTPPFPPSDFRTDIQSNFQPKRLRPPDWPVEKAPNLAPKNHQGYWNPGFVDLLCVGGPFDGEYLHTLPLEYRLVTLNCRQCDAWVHTSLDLTPLLLAQITDFVHAK